jgi:hypothetical protein
MGRRNPRGRGRSGRKSATFQGPTAADRWHGGGEGVGGSVDGGFWEAGGGIESCGVEDCGAAEGGDRGG